MIAGTKIARRRFLAAVAGISASIVSDRASAHSVDWRGSSGRGARDRQGRRSSSSLPISGPEHRRRRFGQSQTLCFVKGTSIATPSGECRVEDLRPGQRVLNTRGQAKTIKWIGSSYRSTNTDGVWSEDALPITIEAGALADQVPHRDLHLSPEHALYLDGILIPAKYLVNGITIYPAKPDDLEGVTYYHLELDAHDAVLAEGAAAESYRDTGLRDTFDVSTADPCCKPADTSVEPFAPLVAMYRRRDKLASHLRSAGSLLIHYRTQFEITRDGLLERAYAIEELQTYKSAA